MAAKRGEEGLAQVSNSILIAPCLLIDNKVGHFPPLIAEWTSLSHGLALKLAPVLSDSVK